MVIALLSATHAASAQSTLEVVRDGDHVNVTASATVRTQPGIVWETIVDYAALPKYVPDMLTSQVIDRIRDDATVEQSGRIGFGPFSFHFAITWAVHESPPSAVNAHAIAGDFAQFTSHYLLNPTPDGGTRLEYEAAIEPKGGVPPVVGVPTMRILIGRQFDALVDEIERRGRKPELE